MSLKPEFSPYYGAHLHKISLIVQVATDVH